ncbi:MAG: THUMP domain-containing protein [Burkholderiaceae bacterium]
MASERTLRLARRQPLAFHAACPHGLEEALAKELEALGAATKPARGGVAFEGDLALAYRANLRSRIASRILLRLERAPYRNEDELYRIANAIDWTVWFGPAQTLRVDVTGSRSPLRSLNFATLRIKDAIVDLVRERTGDRPSIDTRRPDARVFAHLDEREASVYLDLSGEPLFKRGWRQRDDKGEAPLKENLAAGLLALAGWQPTQPLFDPFCGSGTILIEAAQIARGIAPGLSRRFGFERLLRFDEALWTDLRAQAQGEMQAGRNAPLAIFGSDIDPRAIAQARANARRAGLGDDGIGFTVADCRQLAAPATTPGMIVCNPPYGERIDVADGDYEETMLAFGQGLKKGFAGWEAWVLSGDRKLPRHLRIREKRKFPLYNGPIDCRLFGFELFEPTPRG